MNEEFDTFEDVVAGPELDEDLDLDTDGEFEDEEYYRDEYYYEHDDMHDIESALGSAGWGTDEYYGRDDY